MGRQEINFMKIKEWLKLPEAKNISDLDGPGATLLHGKIIRNKPFLKKIYTDFYNQFRQAMPGGTEREGVFVELGSGGGFVKEVIPGTVTSDIKKLPGTDMCFSALKMPFRDNAVSAFFMIGLLHHISDCRAFFEELGRCLKTGGKVVVIEPSGTPWSRFIHRNFHHEAFDPGGDWGFEKGGPLSSSNLAIPSIIFFRDRKKFEKEFPLLEITRLRAHTPFRYLISGGLSMKQLLPSFTHSLFKGIEWILSPLNAFIGLFMTIELEKVGEAKE